MAEITFFAAECMEFPERLGELHEIGRAHV